MTFQVGHQLTTSLILFLAHIVEFKKNILSMTNTKIQEPHLKLQNTIQRLMIFQELKNYQMKLPTCERPSIIVAEQDRSLTNFNQSKGKAILTINYLTCSARLSIWEISKKILILVKKIGSFFWIECKKVKPIQ